MDSLLVRGGRPLVGTVEIKGAKNALHRLPPLVVRHLLAVDAERVVDAVEVVLREAPVIEA